MRSRPSNTLGALTAFLHPNIRLSPHLKSTSEGGVGVHQTSAQFRQMPSS